MSEYGEKNIIENQCEPPRTYFKQTTSVIFYIFPIGPDWTGVSAPGVAGAWVDIGDERLVSKLCEEDIPQSTVTIQT